MTAFRGRKLLSISESIDDMEAYSQLSDAIYYQILHSTEDALQEVSNYGNQLAATQCSAKLESLTSISIGAITIG